MGTQVEHQPSLSLESGLHCGVSIPLADEEMTIGSSIDADVVLFDAGVAPSHARVGLVDGRLEVKPVDAEVVCDQLTLDSSQASAAVFDGECFFLGAVCVRVKGVAAREQTAGSEAAAASGSAVGSGVGRALRRVPGMQGVYLPALPQVQVPPPVRIAGGALLVSSALAATVAWAISMFPAEPAQAAYETNLNKDMQQVRQWANERSIAGVRVAMEGGTVVVSGGLDSEPQAAALRRLLAGLSSNTVNRVTSVDSTIRRVESLVADLGAPNVSIAKVSGKRYTAKGYAGPRVAWERIRQTAVRDLPMIDELRGAGIITTGDLLAEFRRRLEKAGLGQAVVSRVAEDNSLEASGILSSRDLERWDALAQRFRGRLEALGAPALTKRVHSTKELLGKPLRSVSAGPVPYVTTADGKRYLEGGSLPGGYRLREIDTRRLVIARNGKEFVYDLRARSR